MDERQLRQMPKGQLEAGLKVLKEVFDRNNARRIRMTRTLTELRESKWGEDHIYRITERTYEAIQKVCTNFQNGIEAYRSALRAA